MRMMRVLEDIHLELQGVHVMDIISLDITQTRITTHDDIPSSSIPLEIGKYIQSQSELQDEKKVSGNQLKQQERQMTALIRNSLNTQQDN